MWTIIKSTFREALHKRFALAMMVSAVFLLFIVIGYTEFRPGPDGKMYVVDILTKKLISPDDRIQDWQRMLIGVSASLWTIFGIFAMAPLLASPLEKGNAELVFPKGQSRTHVILSKFIGSILVYALTLLFLNGLALAYFRFHVALAWQQHMLEVGMIMAGFVAVMSVMAFVASIVPGQGQMITSGYGVWIFSNVLKARAEYFPSLPFMWMRTVFEWVYRIFPKNSELNEMAIRHLNFVNHQHGATPVTNWMPLWSTLLFTFVVFGITVWRIERRSF